VLLKGPAAEGSGGQEPRVGKVFVIGGAEVYKSALSLPETRRILLTRIRSDFECDTFFPLDLNRQGGSPEGGKWLEMSQGELEAFAGVTVPRGVQVEANTEYEFTIYERGDA